MKLKEIYDNPFRILGASPADPRSKLNALAENASLLGGADVEDAINKLILPHARFQAELNWFPCTNEQEIRKVLDYSGEAGEEAPDFSSDSVLAQFNACRIFSEGWPVTDVASARALCRSFALVYERVSPEKTMEEMNRDREKSGFPFLAEADDIVYRLAEFRRKIVADLYTRINWSLEDSTTDVMVELAKDYGDRNGPYRFSILLADLISAYEMTKHDTIQSYVKTMEETMQAGKSLNQAVTLPSVLKKWHTLTLPGRLISRKKGAADSSVMRLYRQLDQYSVWMCNEWKQYAICEAILQTMRETFSDVPDREQEHIKKNLQIVENMIRKKQ
ncbi:MAG: hypothetical protein IJW67_05865 [Blautia sp.]|nr:hypothetical protein [Blautia sp.]